MESFVELFKFIVDNPNSLLSFVIFQCVLTWAWVHIHYTYFIKPKIAMDIEALYKRTMEDLRAMSKGVTQIREDIAKIQGYLESKSY